jgi:hypothetical protein
MMKPSNLESAISVLIRTTLESAKLLDVAKAAEELAGEYGGDPREIASQITEAGVAARINMKLERPKPTGGAH